MTGRALSPTHIRDKPAPLKAGATIEIAARHRIEPMLQGDLDGLCGLYGAINAIRLALADHLPLGPSASRELFAEGVEFLHCKRGLFAATIEGMGTRRRLALVRHLTRQIRAPQIQIAVERPDHSDWLSMADVFRWIECSLASGSPVLVELASGLDHYTVVAGITSATLLLFDSSGHRFIRKSSCGLRSGFHQIPPNGLLRVAVHR